MWLITLVADGYDDEYSIMLPGKLSQRRAEKRARNECAAMIGCRAKHVHQKSIVKEG